jgi:hypothetical protein
MLAQVIRLTFGPTPRRWRILRLTILTFVALC